MKDNAKCFMQVAYYLLDEEVIRREFDAFNCIRDASPKFVLRMDKLNMSKDGIKHIHIEDFLLHKVDIYLT